MTIGRETESTDRDEPGSCTAIDDEVPLVGEIDVLLSDLGEDRSSVDIDWLRRTIYLILPELSRPVNRLAVLLLDDPAMTRLHQQTLGIPETTDVLTFESSPSSGPLDVDIAVCVNEAARQAVRRGWSCERELLLYVLHGLLHCAGYDDDTEDHAQRMHAVEDHILERIGVGRTFDANGSSDHQPREVES